MASASNEVAPDELGVMSAAQLLISQIGIVAGIQVMVTVQATGARRGGRSGVVPPRLRGGRDRGGRGGGLRLLRPRHAPRGPEHDRRGGRRPLTGAGCATAEAGRRALSSVMAWIRAAISAVAGSGVIVWSAISLAMSPSTLIFPCMKACRPACGLPSTRISRAMS